MGRKRLAATIGCLVLLAAPWPAAGSASERGDHVIANNHGSVALVGDSHTWLAGAGRQYRRYDSDCEAGRDSAAGVGILEATLRPRHRVVVFDLGTNDYADPSGFRRNLRRVWKLIGSDRRLVLVTTASLNTKMAAINAAIRKSASMHPARSFVVQWARYVHAHPEAFDEGGLHFNAAAYERRTRMVKSGVRTVRHLGRGTTGAGRNELRASRGSLHA